MLQRVRFGKAEATEVSTSFSEGPFPLNDAQQSSLRILLVGLPSSGDTGDALADEALMAHARQWLASQPMADLLDSQLRRRHAAAGQPALTVAALAGGNAAATLSRPSGQPLIDGVPTLYTLRGIGEFVQPAFNNDALAEIRTVLGQAPLEP